MTMTKRWSRTMEREWTIQTMARRRKMTVMASFPMILVQGRWVSIEKDNNPRLEVVPILVESRAKGTSS
jgi:hypothetical protein